jgi:hypothetical protein
MRSPTAHKGNDGQLVAGQWAEIVLDGTTGGDPLRGFVFKLGPSEMLLTIPDLRVAPAGLSPGAGVSVLYTSDLGQHTGRSLVLRVAAGPPVTVALELPNRIETDQRRRFPRTAVRLPLGLAVVASSVMPSGREDRRARTRNLGGGGLLVETTLPLAPGDSVKVTLGLSGRLRATLGQTGQFMARVLRVQAVDGTCGYRVGLEFLFDSEAERDCLLRLTQTLARGTK